MKILVIDDEMPLARMAQITLSVVGFQVVIASDGEKGLEMAKTEQPDMVLLDIKMPGMDGFEVLAKLKSAPATEKIPVVMFTTCSTAADKERAHQLGAAGYLVKPADPGKMVDMIKRENGKSAD